MKHSIALTLALLVAALGASRTALGAPCPPTSGNCSVLVDTGTSGARLDVAILGDGYTAAEEAKFFADASALSEALFAKNPYAAYKPLFNAFALYTPSLESGADDPTANHFVDTAFDASYDTNDIYYLLAVDDGKALTEVNTRCPQCDLVVVIVNATPYGGSGGSIAVVSLDGSSVEIARHEIGHTLANLSDEYDTDYPGFPPGDDEPNVAAIHHLDPLKWAAWVTPGTPIPTPISSKTGDLTPVGAYEGARYVKKNMFRPTPTCIMRELGKPFCPVCDEAMVLSIGELSSMIELPTPAGPPSVAPLMATTTFSATLPQLPDLEVSWSLDGVDQSVAVPTFALQPSAEGLATGFHTLVLTVKDKTLLVRDDPTAVLVESHTWNVFVSAVDCAAVPTATPCDDGDACTTDDVCVSGACVGVEPPPCGAPQNCELAGTCDYLTGSCVFPPKVCPGAGSCKLAGQCNPADGKCVIANAPDDSACDDKNACTDGDFCKAGKCKPGPTAKACPGGDACHDTACDKFNGLCSIEPLPDGDPCDDGDLCTLVDTCEAEVCSAESVITCPAPDECHDDGACDPASGECSLVPKANDTPCAEGTCQDGVCTAPPPVDEKPSDDDSCGCRVAATPTSPGATLAALLLGLVALRRRARRCP